MTCAAESCGARETERDRFCSSDAGAIDAAEGGPAHNARGAVYSRCIIWLVAFVWWSLRCLSVRVESHGRRSLLCPSTYTLLPRGGLCVRACSNHKTTATPSPDYNTICNGFVFVHPSPGACLQQRANPVLAVGRTYFPSNFAHKW